MRSPVGVLAKSGGTAFSRSSVACAAPAAAAATEAARGGWNWASCELKLTINSTPCGG